MLLGYDETRFTLHGLRRGGMNHVMTVGLAGADIQLMGDWASSAYLTYIDLNLERRVMNMVRFVDEVDRQLQRSKASNHTCNDFE